MQGEVYDSVYDLATDILIREAELGEAPDGWPDWTDRVTYSISDVEEASQLFGELEDDEDVEQFEEWIDSLQSTWYFQIRSAIETIRSALADYQQDLSIERLLRTIHPA
jgi:hypothetical protein